jgi:hypothetical protein
VLPTNTECEVTSRGRHSLSDHACYQARSSPTRNSDKPWAKLLEGCAVVSFRPMIRWRIEGVIDSASAAREARWTLDLVLIG